MLLLVFVLFYFVCFCVGLFCFCFFFFVCLCFFFFFFFSSRRRHTRFDCDWSSDVCSSDLEVPTLAAGIRVNQASVAPYVDALHAETMLWTEDPEVRQAGAKLLMDVQRRLRALPGPDAWTQALFRLDRKSTRLNSSHSQISY